MKRILCLALISLVAIQSTCPAQNLIRNGSFEEDLDDWIVTGSVDVDDSIVHTGEKSLRVSDTFRDSFSYVYQPLDHTYGCTEISFWIYPASATYYSAFELISDWLVSPGTAVYITRVLVTESWITLTAVDTTVTIPNSLMADTWNSVTIQADAASRSQDFFINGTLVGSLTSLSFPAVEHLLVGDLSRTAMFGTLYFDGITVSEMPADCFLATPVHVAPLDNQSDVSLEGVYLQFGTDTSAVRYNLQVAVDRAFESIIWRTNVPTSPVEFLPPEPGSTYYWRVQAVGGSCDSKFSTPWSFQTSNPVSRVPIPRFPENRSTVPDVEVRLVWTSLANAERYDVQVSRDSTFTDILFKLNTPALEADFVAPVAGASYFWRVQSYDSGGASSGFSATWGFLVAVALPGAVTLRSPADAATGQSTHSEFIWESIDSATAYRLQVSKDSMFESTVVDHDSLKGTSIVPTNPLDFSTTYYWRVRARSGVGWGAWSETWHLETAVGTAAETGAVPSSYSLLGNYPNPFSSSTTLVIYMPAPADVRLSAYNALGREIMNVIAGRLDAGEHRFIVEGSHLPSGTYLYRLESDAFSGSGKMMLAR